MALVWDEKMRPYVSMYAKDEDLFMKDFGAACKYSSYFYNYVF